MIPVEGHPNLFRDENTGAIVNKDTRAFNQYQIAKKRKEDSRKELDEIKQEISEIKSLLKEVLKNGSI